MLSVKNKHPRDENIKFIEEGHYYIDNNGKTYDSVTTVLKNYFPEFDDDDAIDNIRRGKWYKYSIYHDMNKRDIKNLWKTKCEDAAIKGSAIHKDIENAYNYGDLDKSYPEFNMFLDFNYDYPKWQPYRTEWIIYDEETGIAGTIDMVYLNQATGKYIICDWKNITELKIDNRYQKAKKPISHLPNTNFWKYALQQNKYKHILEKDYGLEVEAMYLLVFSPKNTTYKKVLIPDLSKEIQSIINYKLDRVEFKCQSH